VPVGLVGRRWPLRRRKSSPLAAASPARPSRFRRRSRRARLRSAWSPWPRSVEALDSRPACLSAGRDLPPVRDGALWTV